MKCVEVEEIMRARISFMEIEVEQVCKSREEEIQEE